MQKRGDSHTNFEPMHVFPFSTQEDFSHHLCVASLNGLDRKKRQKSKPEIAVSMYYHVFRGEGNKTIDCCTSREIKIK